MEGAGGWRVSICQISVTRKFWDAMMQLRHQTGPNSVLSRLGVKCTNNLIFYFLFYDVEPHQVSPTPL